MTEKKNHKEQYFRDKITIETVNDNEENLIRDYSPESQSNFYLYKYSHSPGQRNTIYNLEMKKITKADQTETNTEKRSRELKNLMTACGMKIFPNYTSRHFRNDKTINNKLTPFQLIMKENEEHKKLINLKKMQHNAPISFNCFVQSDQIINSCGNIEPKKNKLNYRNIITQNNFYNKKFLQNNKLKKKINNNNCCGGFNKVYKNENISNVKQKMSQEKNIINKNSLLNVLNTNNRNTDKGDMYKIIKKINYEKNNKKNSKKNININININFHISNNINNNLDFKFMNDKGKYSGKENNFLMKNSLSNFKLPFVSKNNNFLNKDRIGYKSIRNVEIYKKIAKKIKENNQKSRNYNSQKCQTMNFYDNTKEMDIILKKIVENSNDNKIKSAKTLTLGQG